jgi:hypothetical protein
MQQDGVPGNVGGVAVESATFVIMKNTALVVEMTFAAVRTCNDAAVRSSGGIRDNSQQTTVRGGSVVMPFEPGLMK